MQYIYIYILYRIIPPLSNTPVLGSKKRLIFSGKEIIFDEFLKLEFIVDVFIWKMISNDFPGEILGTGISESPTFLGEQNADLL